MIERYTRKEMGEIWSDQARADLWLRIELCACDAWGRRGVIPPASLQTIHQKASVDLKRMKAIEEDVKHDVIAFLTAVSEKVGPDARFIHFGMTSSDLVDTAFTCQLKKAASMIDADLVALLKVLKRRAEEHKDTVMIGRTHGMHSEPITFGLKVATWYEEFRRHRERFLRATEDIAVGKFSGAVGTYAFLTPEIESEVCAAVGLTPALASTQVIARDRHAHFFTTLAGIASSVERVATEIRHLQRSEISEVAEPFGKSQKGSSAMPHKRNPILSENVTGLARLTRSFALAALENVALWHERDISHSSVERVIAPDATILVDFMLSRITHIIDGLEVFADRMEKNLESSGGLYASQAVLLELVRAGVSREAAYAAVQNAAKKTWQGNAIFRNALSDEPLIQKYMTTAQLETAFDLRRHTQHIQDIFEKIFGRE